MKHLFKLSLLLALLLPSTVSAYDFEVDGICYNINGTNVTVTSRSYLEYYGNVIIPSSVNYNGVTYSVTEIGYSAFYFCDELNSVTIPNSVTSIGDRAFYGCTSLTSIDIPNSVISIGDKSFFGCIGLSSIKVESGNPNYDSRNNCNAIIETSSNKLIVGCVNTTIPNSVTAIGDCAFAYCNNLTSVTIPNSVTSIGENAFDHCHGLTSVHINDLSSWCKISFHNSYANPLSSAHHLFLNGEEIKDMIIPNTLSSVSFATFFGCSGLESVTIPESVNFIGKSAFYGCSGLTHVSIPCTVTYIGSFAFCGCSSLTRVTIPNSVTYIDEWAFSSCSRLTSVTIGNSVTVIYEWAFNRCDNLLEVICLAMTPPDVAGNTWDWDEYGPVYGQATLYVPLESLAAYQAHEVWGRFYHIAPLIGAMPGDVDGDGKINIYDVTDLINILLTDGEITPGADVDGDGLVNISDVTTLINILLTGN